MYKVEKQYYVHMSNREFTTPSRHGRCSRKKIHIAQPNWLKPGFINGENCVEVRVMKESKNLSAKMRKIKSDKINKDDVAVHWVMPLYYLIIKMLRSCPDAHKISFYEELGYFTT